MHGDIFVRGKVIEKVDSSINQDADLEVDGSGLVAIPGLIDDQVHFREPGLTHKATIYSESKAAIAGGVTSFMEMPNTLPPATTQQELEKKYQIASATSLANYSFYLGATNDNLAEILKTDGRNVCGIKIFMGSSTGDLLVDDTPALEKIFAQCPLLIATHCEDESTIRNNLDYFRTLIGDDHLTAEFHPKIRNAEGCLKSSSYAVALAEKYGTRLHVLHISTADELALFSSNLPLESKKITAEVCVHHLFFNSDSYKTLGNQIKCNPAIKSEKDQKALFQGLLDGKLDIIATDHAPHSWDEKNQSYLKAPAGLPLVQHALPIMLEFYHRGANTLEQIVEKMAHAPAVCFQVSQRGFLEEGMFADIVLIDPDEEWKVTKENIAYKCGWSPLVGHSFKGRVKTTIVNGNVAYRDGRFENAPTGMRLEFNRS